MTRFQHELAGQNQGVSAAEAGGLARRVVDEALADLGRQGKIRFEE